VCTWAVNYVCGPLLDDEKLEKIEVEEQTKISPLVLVARFLLPVRLNETLLNRTE